ncbi:sigma-70 family RNA polymerase sigma factor [Ferruginibacter paludis]|uniref:RNA polymerase sigma factor n=1 Tax=Ferruginibacter paludis TaxID=1310417 RepID=UPI0025B4445F|nr:sigma-70 family RNA polymerase sigma factor [Ferruginibacter paludis]MDN3653988.1 sigma-70 family RNA polymerase sigma factor [Ferruginibacter paludis]
MKIATSELQADEESDDYLMELLGMKQDFPDEAMDAYGKIYRRYWDVMLTIARSVTKVEDTAEDLLSDTFNMVYKRAATFKKGKARNPENIRLCILNWMTSIMRNIFYDEYLDEEYKKASDNENPEDSFIINKSSIKKHISDDYDDFIEELENAEHIDFGDLVVKDDNHADSENLKRVKEYMSKLSDRDRDIILEVYNYYLPGKNMPSEVLDKLEKKWGTTRQNIRKILEKFRKAIKETLHSQLFIRK